MPTPITDLALLVRSHRRRAASDREELIQKMRWLIRNLTEEADRLETEPARRPASLGYLGPTSLTTDVDRLAIQSYTASRFADDVEAAIARDAEAAEHDAGMAAAAAAAITIPACLNCGGPMILGLNTDFCTARCEAAHRAVANQTK
jgi:hypothetical protein